MKNILIFLGAIVLVGAIAGGYFFPKAIQNFGSNGGFNTTQKFYEVVNWDMNTGTTTSVYIPYTVTATNVQFACTGVGTSKTPYTGAGTASVTLIAATTTTDLSNNTPTSNTAISNTNNIISGTFATSSAVYNVASSTLVFGGNMLNNQLLGGSYVTFSVDATNTAVCNIGLQAI